MDRITNENIREKFGKIHLRWYLHVHKCLINTLIRRCENMTNTHINKEGGRLKKTWLTIIKHDKIHLNINKDIVEDRAQ